MAVELQYLYFAVPTMSHIQPPADNSDAEVGKTGSGRMAVDGSGQILVPKMAVDCYEK